MSPFILALFTLHSSLFTFGGDLFETLQCAIVGGSGVWSFCFADEFVPSVPQLVYSLDAPAGTGFGCPNRLPTNQYIDRVGVHLRELPQCDPTAFRNHCLEFQW